MENLDTSEKYNELISLLYQASLNPDLWNQCLEHTLDFLEVNKGSLTFVEISPQNVAFERSINHGFDQTFVDAYINHFRYTDPYVGPVAILNKEGDAGRGDQVIDVDDLMTTDYYKNWLKPQGLLHSASGIFSKDRRSMGLISVFSKNDLPLTDIQLEKIRALLPHFKTSFKMHQQVGDLVAQNNAFTDSLEHMPYGILLMGEDGKVIFENTMAKKILSNQDGISLTSRGPIATDPKESRKLSSLLNQATPKNSLFSPNKNPSKKTATGGLIRISRPSNARPFELMAIPIEPKELAHGFTIPLLMLIITDPELERETNEDILIRLYNLTFAEAEVALLLMQGHTPNSICAELGVEISTVRTHMRKVFSKTETSRQADLVRLLLRGLASVQINIQTLKGTAESSLDPINLLP